MIGKISLPNLIDGEVYELREEDIKRASRQYDITLVYAAVLPHCSVSILGNALYHCHNLHILDIRQNKLKYLQGIEHVASTLTLLIASENMLSDISNISACQALECVFLEGNQLQTRESLLPLTELTQLRVLTLCREVVISDGNDHDSNTFRIKSKETDIKNKYQSTESNSTYKQTCKMTIMLDNPVCSYVEQINTTSSQSSPDNPTNANVIPTTKSLPIAKKSAYYSKLIEELFAHVDFVDGVPTTVPEIVEQENKLHTLNENGSKCQLTSSSINNNKNSKNSVDSLILASDARMNEWCTKARTVTADEAELREILIDAKTNV